MATKKAASTKKATAKKPAAANKTTVRTVSAGAKPASRTVATPVARERKVSALPGNIVNIVFAEIVGTFVLTLVALLAFKETGALYLGLAFALTTLAVGAVSGAHFNPAVTFGLWSMRRLKALLLPFYWGSQLLGGMLAVIVINLLTNGSLKLDFGHFNLLNMNWALFGIEMIGAAVFMFGLAAIINRRELTTVSRAFGVGTAFAVGLLVASSLLASVQGAVDTSKITEVKDIPHELRVKSATLNPAIALAATEQGDSSFTGTRADSKEKQYSRFTWEVIAGTLIGAAVGGNLYLLVAGARRHD